MPSFVYPEADPKTEGTTQTYGQDIFIPDEQGNVETQLIEDQAGTLSSPDTVVKIVPEEETGFIDPAVCKSMSDIAVAAASTNDASAVLPAQQSLFDEMAQVSIGSAAANQLANYNTVVPNTAKPIAVVLGSLYKTQEERKKSLTEAQKVDFAVTLRSRESEPLKFNNIKIPEMASPKLVYNFYTTDEDSIPKQENVQEDPLRKRGPPNTPRYVNILWEPTNVTNPLKFQFDEQDPKQKEFNGKVFQQPRGSLPRSGKGSQSPPMDSEKRYNPSVSNGLLQDIMDLQKLEAGFEKLANSAEFPNSVDVTVVTTEIGGLPGPSLASPLADSPVAEDPATGPTGPDITPTQLAAEGLVGQAGVDQQSTGQQLAGTGQGQQLAGTGQDSFLQDQNQQLKNSEGLDGDGGGMINLPADDIEPL